MRLTGSPKFPPLRRLMTNHRRSGQQVRTSATKFWAYAVEIIAAGLLCEILRRIVGVDRVHGWQIEKRSDLLVSIGIAVAVNAAIFAAYFALLSTDFGKRLRAHKAAAEYATAFAYPMFLFFVTAIVLEWLGVTAGPVLSCAITFLLCYSCVNCVTMIRNVIGLVRLWQDVGDG